MNYLFPRNKKTEKPAKQLFCTNCGCSVSNGTSHCPSCGAMPLGHKKYCRHCGTALNPEQVVCVKCNNPIKTDGMTGGESVFWLIVGVIGGVWLLYIGYGLFGIILLVAAIGYFLVELARMIKK
jgi:RNA polymerase subunit RPABC4/transcription elongation factor Spt4